VEVLLKPKLAQTRLVSAVQVNHYVAVQQPANQIPAMVVAIQTPPAVVAAQNLAVIPNNISGGSENMQ
jgi:hypothetical protein